MPFLYALLGFGWPWERGAKVLRARFPESLIEFIGRDRPLRWEDRKYDYRDEVTRNLVSRLFGEGSATSYCAGQGTCGADAGRWSRANCKKSILEISACARRRPQMLIFICHPNSYDLFFERFSRAALFIRAKEDATIVDVGDAIGSNLEHVKGIRDYLANLPNKNYAPRVPFRNFQQLGGCAIAQEAQADLSKFCNVMSSYHSTLYSSDFQNQRKKFMRGAYLLDKRVGFQRDMLHSSSQLGGDSRNDGYHLLNAFHMYGFPVTPGFHFDVSADDGGSLGHVFTDILDGRSSNSASTHVNISPDDRWL